MRGVYSIVYSNCCSELSQLTNQDDSKFFLQPVQINNLEEFVKSLTTEMHERIPNSLVIWYDSVTYKGDLAWQNELNANNR